MKVVFTLLGERRAPWRRPFLNRESSRRMGFVPPSELGSIIEESTLPEVLDPGREGSIAPTLPISR